MTCAIWNRKVYTIHEVGNLIGFLAWLTGEETFTIEVDRRKFEVQIYRNCFGWIAWCPDHYTGEGSTFHNMSLESREKALEGLIENLSEAIAEGKI